MSASIFLSATSRIARFGLLQKRAVDGFGTFADGPFQLTNVAEGTHDLVGYKSLIQAPGTGARMLFRRGQNIVDNGSFATDVDFGAGSPEAFDPASGVMSLTGVSPTESVFYNAFYNTGTGASSCQASNLFFGTGTGLTSFTTYGAPANQQATGDFHSVSVTVSDGTTAFRTLSEYFGTMGARTLPIGTALPVPTITDLSVGYKRLQATGTIPAEYASTAGFFYNGTSSSVLIFASAAYVGGTAINIGLPDFSAVGGWSNTFAPGSAETVTWSVSGSGVSNGGACSEGGRVFSAGQTGTN